MKIVHVCLGNFFIDNYAYQENMLAKYHVMMGLSVTVIASLVTFDEFGKSCLLPNDGEYYSKDGYKVIRINYKKPFYLVSKRLRIYKNFISKLKQENPDIIFVHGIQFLDAIKLKKFKKYNPSIKIFGDNHADYINSARNVVSKYILHKVIWRLVALNIQSIFEKIYGVTPLRCEFLKNIYKINPQKIFLLEMGVDDINMPLNEYKDIRNGIRSSLKIPKEDFVLISGGKIDRLKNIHLLLKAFNLIDNKKIHLIIFGNISSDIENEILTQINRNVNIHYLGWIQSNKVIEYLFASDLAVFPGTHSVLWEQVVGAGLPALFKYWYGMEHVNLGGNCIFLKDDSLYEIKNAIENIITNKEFYSNMKRSAQNERVKFAYSTIAKKSIGLL